MAKLAVATPKDSIIYGFCGVSQSRSGLRSILSSLGQARRRQNKRTKRTGSAAQSAGASADTPASADLQARTSADQATGTILISAYLFFIGLMNNYFYLMPPELYFLVYILLLCS